MTNESVQAQLVCQRQALIPSVNAGSDLSLDRDPSERREPKKSVKDKLTGMFKKNPSSRTGR